MCADSSARTGNGHTGNGQEVPGLDLKRLGEWIADTTGDAATHLTAEIIAGGRSNLTYAVTDGDREWIVRRPPLGHVLATAHDMAREYRVMTALADTDVPVPKTHGFCANEDVIGAPFYLMERMRGTPYRRASELEALGRQRTRIISIRLVDTLAALHRIAPGEVGLSDFGRPDGYLARQVARWKKQFDGSRSRDLPAADELYARLAVAVPTESGVSVVHGDYRLDNVLVDERDRPTAVLDWEMATLGDPLSDLALMLTYHRLGELTGPMTDSPVHSAVVTDASRAEGFLTEAEILERYGSVTGRDLNRFGFYLGLAAYKAAAILEGIHYRHLHGQTVGEGFDHIGDSVHPLLAAGLDALKENR